MQRLLERRRRLPRSPLLRRVSHLLGRNQTLACSVALRLPRARPTLRRRKRCSLVSVAFLVVLVVLLLVVVVEAAATPLPSLELCSAIPHPAARRTISRGVPICSIAICSVEGRPAYRVPLGSRLPPPLSRQALQAVQCSTQNQPACLAAAQQQQQHLALLKAQEAAAAATLLPSLCHQYLGRNLPSQSPPEGFLVPGPPRLPPLLRPSLPQRPSGPQVSAICPYVRTNPRVSCY